MVVYGFVCYKKQNPTTSTGPYAHVRLPEMSTRNFFPLDQCYTHLTNITPTCPPSNTLFHL